MANPAGYAAPQALREAEDSEFVDAEAGKILDPTAAGGSAAPVTLGPNEGQSAGSQLADESDRTVAAPDTFTATADTPVAGDIRLDWNDPNTNETGYEIQVSSDGGTTYGALVTTAADDVQHDHTVGAAATRHYRIRATHADGNSTWAGPVSATTA